MEKNILKPLAGTIDNAEIAKFSAMAKDWWDADGKFAPLHKFNPVRVAFIRDQIIKAFAPDEQEDAKALSHLPLKNVRLLDIGCGGGLLCEPMTRLGANVTGIDASEQTIEIAKSHAKMVGLNIDYRFSTVEALAKTGEQFDVVLNMEVVEHVADVDLFLQNAAALVRPGGIMVLATLNRTAKAFLLAIIGAEYVLRWLPRGTHDWRKFLKPSELAAGLRPAQMTVNLITGMCYNPISGQWRLDQKDFAVNYLMVTQKAAT